MILIFFSWLYIAFTAISLGVVTERILKIEHRDLMVTGMFGLFATSVLAGFWATTARINLEFHIFLLGCNLISCMIFRKAILRHVSIFLQDFRAMPAALKAIIFIIAVLILAQCSAPPYAVDNESYYIQTIKWLNEYGFVNGLANLHIFFAQTSGWHVVQSAFNFSFAYDRFNDLSGFCLLLGNIFAVIRLDQYFKNNSRIDLIIGLFPLANVLLFQFVGAPSPDIPIYVLSFMIAYFFGRGNPDAFKIMSVLAIFAIFIKPTALPLAAFPLLVFLRHLKKMKFGLMPVFAISAIVGALYLAKNYIISGYLLFPTANAFGLHPNWQVPIEITQFYFTETKLFAFRLTEAEFDSMSAFELFRHWLLLPKLHGLFNIICVALLAATPVVLYRNFNKRRYWQLYLLLVAQMLVLLVTSPQYRFFLNIILLLSFICLAAFIHQRKLIIGSLFVATMAAAIPLFYPLSLHALTQNQHAVDNSVFSLEYILHPHSNSKISTGFEAVSNAGLKYYSPVQNDFFWGTFDGPLPCVNKTQLQYFESRFHVRPQMRKGHIAEGFSAKPIP